MRYRSFSDSDYPALQALDLRLQRHQDPRYDALSEREREGRLHTSLAALRFYQRSEHSFAAEDDIGLQGFVLAQHVWQGDKPVVLLRALVVSPDAPPHTAQGLLHALYKSAYDTAVYEVHFPLTPALQAAALAEGGVFTSGQYAIRHLGSRAETAPGKQWAGSQAEH